MTTPSKSPPSPIETMKKERENCPFDLRRMTYAVGGGEADVKLKEKFMVEIERDPNFRLDDIHDLSKDQLRERTMAKFASMVYFVLNEPIDVFQKRMSLISVADPGFWTRFGVHYGLFVGALRSSATPNQMSYWLEKGALELRGMAGCFGMTELAHGSNVAGLETTATFDPVSDEFVIHTPSVSATKWWIGGAAQTATHCAVYARLIVKGVDHGTKIFIVPLRNPKNFALLPGVAIGDIGKKMGRDGIDNGWIQFTNVRIPRGFMLMRHTQVSRDGAVSEPPLAQLAYGALLLGRTHMVADSANIAKKALTIAIRYAAVRRQFKVGNKEFESQILDYPIHQRRLLPLLAEAIAMGFTALRMTELFNDLTERLERLGSDSDAAETKDVLEKLKETHSTSAGLKAFSTWNALETIERCRASCGGHGYSAYTGLASMYNDQAVMATWEGDNTILALQAGRSLVSAFVDAERGLPQPLGTAYLNDLPAVLEAKCPSDSQATDLEVVDNAWKCIAANVVKKASERYAFFLSQNNGKEEALELCSQERFLAAKVHTIGYMYRMFREGLNQLAASEPKESGVVMTLEKVCKLYGVWSVEQNASYFLKYGFYTAKQIDFVTESVDLLCADIRQYAVPLVDSFNWSDHIINSPLGVHNGNVYEVYFRRVRAANPHQPVHPYFDRIIKPLLERDNLILDDDEIDLDNEIEEIHKDQAEAVAEAKAKAAKEKKDKASNKSKA